MSTRFDVTRVTLRQYRSIRQCDVHLGSLALLVGPNGSGKSNFLDAFRLTSDALSTTLDNALRDRGGVGEVRRRSAGHPTHFAVKFGFSTDAFSGSYSFRVGAVKGGDFAVTDEQCSVVEHDLGGTEAEFVIREGELVRSTEAVLPAPAKDRLFLVAASNVGLFRAVFDGLSNIRVFSLNPDEMRRLQKPDSGDSLRRDGSNVASVLERLRREDPDGKRLIQDYLRAVVPTVQGVDRQALGAWEALEFLQRVPGAQQPWKFQGSSVSDGTLRALGALTALFAESGSDVFSPVGIEEPESALHPAAAGVLLDALRVASSRRQVIATTHSPDLLDSPSIEPAELLAVRAEDGETHIAPVDSVGRRAIAEQLFTPGELLRVDQLLPESPAAGPVQQDLFAS